MSLSSLIPIAYRKGWSRPRFQLASAWLGLFVCGFFVLQQACAADNQKTLRVAAAADLQTVLPSLADAYEKATGVKLLVSYGSSGTLATQILNGAPMDIFLGADFVFPEKIVAAGLSDMTAPTAYAKGTLVLWARKDSPLQPITVEKIGDPQVKSIAIADEAHAPYGRAAVSALKQLKLYEKVQPHLVIAENVAQAGQYAESGNAQMGLISLTLAVSEHYKKLGTFVRVPTVYPAILQCAVVMKTERKADAHAFLDWLLTSEVQGKLQNYGLGAVR